MFSEQKTQEPYKEVGLKFTSSNRKGPKRRG